MSSRAAAFCLAIAAMSPLAALAEEAAPDAAAAPPRPVAQVGFALGYNTEAGAAVSGFVNSDTLLGPGQQLGLEAQVGEHGGRIDLDYRLTPLFGRQKLSFGMDVSAVQAKPEEVFDFSSESVDVTPRLVIDLSPRAIISPYVGYSVGRVTGAVESGSILIRADEGERRRTSLGTDVSIVAARTGEDVTGLVDFGVELGRTDTGHSYTRLSLGWKGKHSFGAVELSSALTAATIQTRDGVSPLGDRSVLGQSTIRGFAFGGFGPRDLAAVGQPVLGGNSYAAVQVDARFPTAFGSDARIVPGVFMDVGSLWGLDNVAGGAEGTDPVDDGAHIRASVGVTLNYVTDYGVLSLSAAHAIAKQDYDKTEPLYLSFRADF